MKFLIFTTDLPPLPGSPTSGTALRTFNLAEGLRESGHEIMISPPKSAMDAYELPANADGHLKATVAQLKKLSFDASTQDARVQELNPDAIICGHWPAWTLGRKPKQPLIIDLAGPHLLERHFQGESSFDAAVYGKLTALSCADYFIVSGNKQKLYFLSFLLKANIPDPEKRICNIPMPLPTLEDEPEKLLSNKASIKTLEERSKDKKFPSIIFGGVFLPWQDPSFSLKVLSEELTKRQEGSLTLVGGPHPHYKINSGSYEELFASLESNAYVKRKPLLPFEEFSVLLPEMDVALDLMAWNLERELAITIRTTTYLWSGIPIIYNNFADLSTSIKEYDAGWCIDPANKEELLGVLDEIYKNPEIIKIKSKNAFRLAKDLFDRKSAAQKILELLETPQVPLEEQIDILMELPELCEYSLLPNIPLTQHFACRMNGLQEVSLMFGTHSAKISGDLEITLYEKYKDPSTGSKKIKTLKKDASEIQNNEWITLELDPITDSAGKHFYVEIKKDSETRDPLGPWMMKSSPYPMQGLYEGNKKLGINSLCFKTKCLKPDVNSARALDA